MVLTSLKLSKTLYLPMPITALLQITFLSLPARASARNMKGCAGTQQFSSISPVGKGPACRKDQFSRLVEKTLGSLLPPPEVYWPLLSMLGQKAVSVFRVRPVSGKYDISYGDLNYVGTGSNCFPRSHRCLLQRCCECISFILRQLTSVSNKTGVVRK